MPRGDTLAGGDGGPEWQILPDDVFVPRRGRGRVDLAGAMARRLGTRKRHRHSGNVFVPRRAPRTGPPADPNILVVSSRVRTPRSALLSEQGAVESSPASWDGVWDAKSAAAAVRDHDGDDSDPNEVFAAHIASGWTLRPRHGVAGDGSKLSGEADGENKLSRESPFENSNTRGASCLELCAPDDRRADGGNVTAEARSGRGAFGASESQIARIDVLREAFGLELLAPRDPKHSTTLSPIARAIARLCGGISAARLGGVTCRERRWCRVGLDESFTALEKIAACEVSLYKNKNASAVARRAAAAAGDLAAGVTRSLREAERALDEDEALRHALRLSESFSPEKENATDSIGSGPDDAFARAMGAMGAGATQEPARSTRDVRDPAAYGNAPARVDARVTHRCAIALASALDEAWFQVAYHARACGWCDPSDAYGSGSRKAGSGETSATDLSAAYFAAVENAAFRDASRSERLALVEKARADPNPLAAVLHSRLREGARLFAHAREEEKDPLFSRHLVVTPGDGVGERAVVAAAEKENKKKKNAAAAVAKRRRNDAERNAKERTPKDTTLPVPACPPLTRAWRDACRSWPCRLYAFAAPTAAALRALRKSATRWLEVGAGAGYWAAQMRRSGMDVVAVDVDPPGEETHNAYHGSNATWHPVVRGDAATARSAGETTFSGDPDVARRALFMCYPPPGFDSRMAVETLEAYGGGVLALVGEWDGNTADGAFASLLTEHWYLARRAALPQWGDTAHELTVWRRKKQTRLARGGAEEGALPLKSCAWCGGGRVSSGAAKEAKMRKNSEDEENVTVLRRCVLCRDDFGIFCSASCCSLGVAKHSTTHELRLIPTPVQRLKDWSAKGDYEAFRPFNSR